VIHLGYCGSTSWRSLGRLGWLSLVSSMYLAPAPGAEWSSSVVSADDLRQASFTVSDAVATGTFGPVEGDAGRTDGWTIDVARPGRRLWSAQLAIPLAGPVAVGDVVLISFRARATRPPPDGVAGGVIAIENKTPGNPKLGMGGFTADGEWRRVDIPFLAGIEAIPAKAVLAFQLGERSQRLQIADLTVTNYRRSVRLADLPRTTIDYPGRSADAGWRRDALARIEKHRIRDFEVRLVDEAGRPLENAAVQARLARHEFLFGGTIKAEFFKPDDTAWRRYRDAIDGHFSAVVFENDLKPGSLQDSLSGRDEHVRWEWTAAAAEWCRERDIAIRGHYMVAGVWGSFASRDRATDATLRERLFDHLRLVAERAGPLVHDFDVLNHPVGWSNPPQTVRDVLGPDFYADVIRSARKLTDRPLWINEDRTFHPGFQQDNYIACIRELLDAGTPPDGIGIQGHFHSGSLVAPDEMLRVSDRLANLVPALMLTEWDVMTNGDEALQADYLRDTLIAAYSHPAYRGFLMWVWWEGAGWRPEAALFRRDGSEKPNGRIWRELVSERWRTHARFTADSGGLASFRGHAGLYDLTIEHEGRTARAKVSLPLAAPRKPVTVTVRRDEPHR
jgi:endo-1,4-beta-xylanase